MRLPIRLAALPASLALTAVLVGVVVAPSEGGDRPSLASAAAPASGACSGAPAAAVEAARERGMSYDFLMGSSFKRKLTAVGSRAVVLDAGDYTTSDFTAGTDRVDSSRLGRSAAGLIGAGSGATHLEMAPRSSTRKRVVPTTEYEVNPLNVLRVTSEHPVVGGFSLTGSPQGHTYNGLRIDRAHGAQVVDVHVSAIPGDMDRPPGETFGINDYKTVGSVYEHVEVDGAGVGAAGFAANGSQGITVCDASSHDNPISMGFAFWSVKDITLVDCTATDNGFTGFNFERVSGDVRLIRPKAEDNRWDMRVVSDLGSARYTIVDPDLTSTQVPGRWTIELPSTYWKHPSLQKRSDVTLIVDGKVRNDLIRWVVPY
ncbi:hypothetical protein [Amnibacterium endophyticum]|uniref:Right handed beta helix domain-containing protein n=1 Tax=Amnibacterium endophyticum TaxID=2109337 RepID=A0ABW4LLR0_9MICO